MNKRREMQRFSKHFLPILTLIGLAAVGCAGQTPQAHDARGAGQWTFRLPQTHSPYADLAIGHGSSEPTALAVVDDALASTAAPSATQAPAKPRSAVSPRPTFATNTQPAPAPQPAAPVAVQAQPEQLAVNAPPASSADDELRYSERDQQSQKQREFRGGDAVVIGASTLVIILLIVILVLVLT